MARILIIDDDDQVRLMLRRTLEAAGHETSEASNGKDGLMEFAERPVDLIITDIYMPEKEGLETIIELKRDHPAVHIIAISGGSREVDIDFLPVAERLGAERTFSKPVDREVLVTTIDELLAGK
jgi:CheY-like chemotaxis protein